MILLYSDGGCLMTMGSMVTPYALSRNASKASKELVGVGLMTARRTALHSVRTRRPYAVGSPSTDRPERAVKETGFHTHFRRAFPDHAEAAHQLGDG